MTTAPAEISDHYDGRRFFNPGGANGRSMTEVPKMLRETRTPWPEYVPVVARRPPVPAAGETVVTFVGHSTFLIQTPRGNIVTDPVWSERASPVSFAGPRRRRAPGIGFEDLPRIDVVLLSHNHYDHCDFPTLRRIAGRYQPMAITPLGNGTLLRKAGYTNIEVLDWWDRAARSPMPVTCVPAQHFSSRGPFDRNRALWSGFQIEAESRRLLFAGDSGYGGHFKTIRERLGAPDLALLPIGAYEPRWFMKDIHMNPAEAVQAHRDLGARRSIAMHFGTFQLTPEGIDEPVTALRKELTPGDDFRVLEVGESLTL